MKNSILSLVISYLLLLLPILTLGQSIQSLSIGNQTFPNLTANNLVNGQFAVGANLSTLAVVSTPGPFGLTVEGTPAGAADPDYSANFAATAAVVPLGPIQLPVGAPYVLRIYSRPARALLATYTIYNTGVPLPVQLVSFSARSYGAGAAVRWQTAVEDRILGFVVERSQDGTNFVAVAKVTARGTGVYQVTDASRGAYYRLCVVEADSSCTYSGVAALPSDKDVVPHLVQVGDNYFTYSLRAGEKPARLELYSVGGQRLLEQSSDLHRLAYPTGQQPYLLILFTTQNRPVTQRVF